MIPFPSPMLDETIFLALPQTIYFTTPGNFQWKVLQFANSVTVSVWGAGGEGANTYGGTAGVDGVSSLFYAPAGTLIGYGGQGGGATNNLGAGGMGTGGSLDLTGGAGDAGNIPWNPTYINDGTLDLWFDASVGSSLTISGANVISWGDLVNGVVVNSTAARPTYNGNLLNGLPGIVFHSPATGFVATTAHGSFTAPLSVFAVITLTTAFQSPEILTAFTGGVGQPSMSFSSTDHIAIFKTGVASSASTQGLAMNTPAIAEWVAPSLSGGSWGPVQPYITGVAGGVIAAIAGYGFTQTGIMIGLDSTGVGGLVGNLHELVVLKTQASTTNRQLIEGYLAWKWGLKGGLPSSHPYKSTIPTHTFGDSKGGAAPAGGGLASSVAGNFPGGGGAGILGGHGGGAGGYTQKVYVPGQLAVGSTISLAVGSGGGTLTDTAGYIGANGQITISVDQGYGPAPLFIGASYASNNQAGAGPLTIARPPATQSGDLILAYMFSNNVISPSSPGWTFIQGSVGVDNIRDSRLWYKVVGNEPSNYTWINPGDYPEMVIRTYRGANTSTPINSTISSNGNSTSCSIPALSETAAPNEVYVAFWNNYNQNNNLTAPSDLVNISTDNTLYAMLSGDKVVSGTAGQETATLAGISNLWNGIGVSIVP